MAAGVFRYEPMPDTAPHLKAAFATDSLTWVDADFAWARHLLLYDITPVRAEMLDAAAFRKPAAKARQPNPSCPGDRGSYGVAETMSAKIAAMGRTGVLFTTGLSDRAAMDLAAARIFPVVIEQRRSIHETITRLQRLMHRDPPLWMCRMLRYGGQTHDR